MRRFILTIISILIVIIFASPIFVESQLRKWVKSHGGESFTIANIDFNPFTTRLFLEDVHIFHKGKQTLNLPYLKLEMSWRKLLQQKIVFENVVINGLRVDISYHGNDKAHVGGISLQQFLSEKTDETEKNTPDWYFSIDSLDIQDSSVHYSDPKIKTLIEIATLNISNVDSGDIDNQSGLLFDGKINHSATRLEGLIKPLAPRLAYVGSISTEDLDITPFAELDVLSAYNVKGIVSIDSSVKIEFQAPEAVHITHNGDFTISDFHLKTEQLTTTGSKIHWEGEIDWKNKQPAISGKIQLKGFRSKVTTDPEIILNVDSIDLTDVVLADFDDLNVQQAVINNLLISHNSGSEQLLSNKYLGINGIELNEIEGLQVNRVQMQGLDVNLQKYDSNQWNFSEFISGLLNNIEKHSKNDAIEKEVLRVAVNDFLLKDAVVRFNDQSIAPVFSSIIEIGAIKLSAIDSEQPEVPIYFSLNATIDESSQLVINGDSKPFHKDLPVTVSLQVKGYPMPPISPYTAKVIGYDMNSGEMDLESDIKINANKIDASNKLKFYHLKVKALGEERLAALGAKKIGSLEAGLSILRNNNNTIKLDLPIKGTMDDIRVNSSDVINQAIGSALKTGAKTYLAAAIFPFGTLLVVADSLSDKAMKIELDPIIFEPGSILLSEQDHQYLEKISTILKERPKLRLRVCGRATLQDQQDPKLPDERLLGLAENRAKAVDDFLIKKMGMDNHRLVSCKAKIIVKNNKKPRVELQF